MLRKGGGGVWICRVSGFHEEIVAFGEGREFIGQDPNIFYKHTFLYCVTKVN